MWKCNREVPQTVVLKYDWWSLCKITPSDARRLQQLLRVENRKTTLSHTKSDKQECSNITDKIFLVVLVIVFYFLKRARDTLEVNVDNSLRYIYIYITVFEFIVFYS